MGRRGAKAVAGAALAAAVGAAGLMVVNKRPGDTGTPPVTGVSTGTAAVSRMDIAERRQVNGTLDSREHTT